MSTDYSAVCMVCRQRIHIGVRFTSGFAFGHGSNDADGRAKIGAWIVEHGAGIAGHIAFAEEEHDVRIVVSDAVPDDFTDIEI